MNYIKYLVICTIILCACATQPVYANGVCYNHLNIQIPCSNEIQPAYYYPYTPYPYAYQYIDRRPSYKVDIDKPAVPQHNYSECIIATGCNPYK